MTISKKLIKLEMHLNRLRSEKAALEYKEKRKKEQLRKSRTRTLIQLGGLLELTELPSICGINLGDDLQDEMRTKAALLLGILIKYTNRLPEEFSETQINEMRIIGNTILATQYLKKEVNFLLDSSRFIDVLKNN